MGVRIASTEAEFRIAGGTYSGNGRQVRQVVVKGCLNTISRKATLERGR